MIFQTANKAVFVICSFLTIIIVGHETNIYASMEFKKQTSRAEQVHTEFSLVYLAVHHFGY